MEGMNYARQPLDYYSVTEADNLEQLNTITEDVDALLERGRELRSRLGVLRLKLCRLGTQSNARAV
jgi:hypothetical protein